MRNILEPMKCRSRLTKIIASAIIFSAGSIARADSFGLGAAGPSYWGVLETGSGQVSFSGPATYNGSGAAGIYGTATEANVGINAGKLNASSFTIDGTYYRYASSPADSIDNKSSILGGITTVSGNPNVISTAVAAAQAANATLSTQTCTMTTLCGTNITSGGTITGVAGMNVLTVSNINLGNSTLILSGPAGASFLILDSGNITLNSSSILVAGGLQDTDVLIDILGGGTVSTAGGIGNESVIDGILMNLNGKFQMTPGGINGEVIGGKDISFASGGGVNVPNSPSTPEPRTALLLGAGLCLLAGNRFLPFWPRKLRRATVIH